MRYFRKLIGDKIFLSPMNMEDLNQYTEWLNDLFITMRLGNATENITIDKEKELLESLNKDGHNYAIVDKEADTLLGNIGLFNVNNIHRVAEIGLFIGNSQSRGKGYGTEAMRLLMEYGFKVLNLNNIMLTVKGFNENAIGAYKKIGFKEFGRRTECYFINGKYHDVIYMQVLAKEFKSDFLGEFLP